MNAAALLRDVGLMADGPVVWGRPVPARGPGVFVAELAAPRSRAPIELTRVGKWIERVPTLTLDGERPTSRALSARIGSFWLPSQVVLYVGASTASLGARIAAMGRTVLGDRRPHSGGHWLQVLDGDVVASLRVWWAETDATEEYEDALLATFAAGVPAEEIATLPDRDVVLPFANLRRPTGERRASGLAGSLIAEVPEPVPPPARVVVVPDGDAEGARGEPPERRRRPAAARAPAAAPRTATRSTPAGTSTQLTLTAEGAERLRAELRELTEARRPEVIARIRTAKEHGDLKENAEYHAAREEQSFLEGRIQALETRLRDAVIADAPVAGGGADIGSRVTVEVDGSTETYTLVGSPEADPAARRLSVAAPVGKALLGAGAGDEVTVETPRGPVVYRVVSVD